MIEPQMYLIRYNQWCQGVVDVGFGADMWWGCWADETVGRADCDARGVECGDGAVGDGGKQRGVMTTSCRQAWAWTDDPQGDVYQDYQDYPFLIISLISL